MLKPPEADDEKMRLGLTLTLIQVAIYLSFLSLCCFNPSFVKGSLANGNVPYAFYFGLAVIGSGIVMTIIYVLTTNKDAGKK